MSTPETHETSFHFPLLWTIGFTGKRHLTAEQEIKIEKSITQALNFFREKAQKQGAGLTAISSIARGGDVIFAKCCQLGISNEDPYPKPIPWKCLLPFEREDFFERDLKDSVTPDGFEVPIVEKEQEIRTAAADKCLSHAFLVTKMSPEKDEDPNATRVTAYQECGYRTVDESDVMIVVLHQSEFDQLSEIRKIRDQESKDRMDAIRANKTLPEPKRLELSSKAGSLAIAVYAIAAGHPCIVLNAGSNDPWESRRMYNHPRKKRSEKRIRGQWFKDPIVTDVVQHALARADKVAKKEHPVSGSLPEQTPSFSRDQLGQVEYLMAKLGEYAEASSRWARRGMVWILTLHIVATALAAFLATVMGLSETQYTTQHNVWPSLLIGIIVLAYIKPLLASAAYLIDLLLHKGHTRETWLVSRILCELCRGACATWPLSQQPLDAADEEDFPKVMRLLRTLRLMREKYLSVGICNTPTDGKIDQPYTRRETQSEIDMRLATEYYVNHRLLDQAHHYRIKQAKSVRQHQFWNALFHAALCLTIVLGLSLAFYKTYHYFETKGHAYEYPWSNPFKWVEFGVIIGPFIASYALGMITIRDCRRRTDRYGEMERFLHRLADTLRACSSNGSRLRLIEHAERMLIEEQHEWFSTTRNFNV